MTIRGIGGLGMGGTEGLVRLILWNPFSDIHIYIYSRRTTTTRRKTLCLLNTSEAAHEGIFALSDDFLLACLPALDASLETAI